MTVCLLCLAVAVQDALCVPCGAKLWAATLWDKSPKTAAHHRDMAREVAIRFLPMTPREEALYKHVIDDMQATDFLAHLEARKALRLRESSVCPGCERIVPRDEHKENCERKT